MELEFAPRERPTRDGFPARPRGVRKWLADLAALEGREAARRFSEGVHTLNRLEIPPRRRLRIMELLRPTAREVLDHVGGRIQAISLPLPERSRQVFELNLSLLRELAMGYELVLDGDARSSGAGPRRRARLAAERALWRHGEFMLRSAQVYAPLPEAFWQRVHAVFAHADGRGVSEQPVAEPELSQGRRPRQSPVHTYKRILMFSIAQTEGLRKGESERIHGALEEWANDAALMLSPPDDDDEAETSCRFAVDLARPRPPVALRLFDGGAAREPRILDVTRALERVERVLEEVKAAEHDNSLDATRISSVGLQRLIENWQQRAVRRSERARHGDAVEAEVTLPLILQRLEDDAAAAQEAEARAASENEPRRAARNGERSGAALSRAAALTLQTIDTDDADREDTGYVTHPGFAGDNASGRAWDAVGRQRPMAPGYMEEWRRAEQDLPQPARPAHPHWLLEDSSRAGFRLRWAGDGTSRATVGELIAVREDERWRVGVIRWMQFVDEVQFLVGCRTLAQRASAARVRRPPANRNRRRHRETESSEPALLLPGNKSRQRPPTILVPAHMFREGEKLELSVRDRDLRVELARTVETTGSFTQFEIAPAEPDRRSAGSAGANGQPSLWNSL